jgi:hypothetical protein
MKDHITDMLDLFIDGELGTQAEQRIKAHLLECEGCARELSRRQSLSALIRSQPGMKSLKSQREFTEDVMTRIKQGIDASRDYGNQLEIAWFAIPLLLVAGLIFLQTVWTQSSLVSFVAPISEMLEPGQILLPFSFAIPSPFDQFIRLVPGSFIWSWNWVTTGILAIALGFLYVTWLAGWWIRNQNHANA